MTAATPAADGTLRVVVNAKVLSAAGGTNLGNVLFTYDIKPEAEVAVHWRLDWTASDTRLWEEGLKFSLPASQTHMRWLREAFFTDYPAGHLGEPAGEADASQVQFRASKRKLQWLTLTDRTGQGVALLPVAGVPLTGRANSSEVNRTTLFASREVAGPQDFSGGWVSGHDIRADKDQPLSGAFILRAIVP